MMKTMTKKITNFIASVFLSMERKTLTFSQALLHPCLNPLLPTHNASHYVDSKSPYQNSNFQNPPITSPENVFNPESLITSEGKFITIMWRKFESFSILNCSKLSNFISSPEHRTKCASFNSSCDQHFFQDFMIVCQNDRQPSHAFSIETMFEKKI